MTPNNGNILLGSTLLYANKAIMWGDMNACSIPIQKFNFLSRALDYAMLQYENDPTSYGPVVNALNAKLFSLRDNCEHICNYRMQIA